MKLQKLKKLLKLPSHFMILSLRLYLEVKEVKEVKKVKSEDEVKEEEVPLENTVVEAPAAEPLDPNQKVLHIQSQKKHVAEAAVHVEKAPVPSYIFKSHGKKKA